MKKIMLSVLLSSMLVANSVQCAKSEVKAEGSSWIPACVSNACDTTTQSIKDHYILWSITGVVVVGTAAVVLYDALKNDKKLLKKSEELAKKFFEKTYKENPKATVVVVAGGLLLASLGSYDYFWRDEDNSLIKSLFKSKDESSRFPRKAKENVDYVKEKNPSYLDSRAGQR